MVVRLIQKRNGKTITELKNIKSVDTSEMNADSKEVVLTLWQNEQNGYYDYENLSFDSTIYKAIITTE